MLLTDGLAITTADLLRIDSEIEDIAESCQPVITIANTILDAQQEVSSLLLGMMARFGGRGQNTYAGPDYGSQALYTESSQRPRCSLSQIVVTDAEYPGLWSDLQRYLVYVTLYNFYRDASRRNNPSRDRYAEKREVYEEEIRNKYLPRLKKSGMPIVGRPLPRPGAQFEPGSGTWASTNLSIVAGGSGVADASYDVAITWLDSTAPQNNESAPSDTVTIAVPAGQQVQISIANLTAPNGTTRPASAARVLVQPLTANFWKVYAAVSGQPLTLQATVPYSQKTYTLDVPTTSGAPVGVGQYAEVSPTIQAEMLFRG
jgi:hypothetical protein